MGGYSMAKVNQFDDSIKDAIALTLQDLREQRGLTQKEVAKAFNLSYSTISHYEQGITVPPTEIVYQFASFYNVSTDYILNRCTSKIDFTKIVDTKLNNSMTIGNAVEIMTNMNRHEREHFAYILKLFASSK